MRRDDSDGLPLDFPDNLSRSACRFCGRRKECPYARNQSQSLRCVTTAGKGNARLLSMEAGRLLEKISCADQIRCLLRADDALERTLSKLLYAELRAER